MFCVRGLVFGSTKGVESRFNVLRSRTRFQRCRVYRVLFSYFARPDSFSAMPRASGPVFMFCAPRLIFDGTEGAGSRFDVLRFRTCFRRYRGRLVPYSCFARPDSFSAVPRASGPVFNFCTPELIFGGIEGVRSLFQVLRFQTHFRRYRGRRVPFSSFALPDSFSAVSSASGATFLFRASEIIFGGVECVGSRFHVCAPGLVFGDAECVLSHFHVLRARTNFRWYRGRLVLFSCFVRPYSFSTVQRASCPVFMFCAPGLFFGGTEVVGFRFHVFRYQTHFQRYRGCGVPFSCFALSDLFSAVPRASGPFFLFCAPGLLFGGTECLVPFSCFVCLVPVQCFAHPNSFSTVPRASGPVFMFCAPELIFGGTESVGTRFHVFGARTHFRWYRGLRVPFSYFTRPDSFSVMPRASGPVFTFCVPEIFFGGTEGVGSHFLVLRARTHFQRYREHRFPFSCFARHDSFSTL
jgi:hypothetical protein